MSQTCIIDGFAVEQLPVKIEKPVFEITGLILHRELKNKEFYYHFIIHII
jgi:hypothetical protein